MPSSMGFRDGHGRRLPSKERGPTSTTGAQMNIASRDRGLTFPFPEPPAPGLMIEVAPGVMWARIAMPCAVEHATICFIEDGDGWAVLDTGINNEATRAAWEGLVAGLGGRRLT